MEAIKNINCDLNNSLKQALINSAMQTFDELIEEKSEDIVNKYKNDPRYVKVCELLEEKERLSTRIAEVDRELDSILRPYYRWITSSDSCFISNYLAGIIDLREKLNKKIQNHVEIETSSPCFDPRHTLNKLNEIAREAISKINI